MKCEKSFCLCFWLMTAEPVWGILFAYIYSFGDGSMIYIAIATCHPWQLDWVIHIRLNSNLKLHSNLSPQKIRSKQGYGWSQGEKCQQLFISFRQMMNGPLGQEEGISINRNWFFPEQNLEHQSIECLCIMAVTVGLPGWPILHSTLLGREWAATSFWCDWHHHSPAAIRLVDWNESSSRFARLHAG